MKLYLYYVLMISSKFQTKEWRKIQKWYNNGKFNECEKFQLISIKKITNLNIFKCFDRINCEEMVIEEIKFPFKWDNGYEYTENFDGKIEINNYKIYFNLKFVCDQGGAQTRTLKNVYNFIKCQYRVISENSNIIIINILDGDESFRNINKFLYIKKKYPHLEYICFIGDLYNFNYWYMKRNCLFELSGLKY